jgi:nucleotide-binding universal stress UspA family protein
MICFLQGGIVMFAPKRILVPTDFSDSSDEALKQAMELAKQYNARVYLLHVAEPITQCTTDYCSDITTVKKAKEAEILQAKEMMQKELKKFSGFQEIEVISDIREGEPVEEILKEQEEKQVDLIVMPHGKTGLMKRLMGQISEKRQRSSGAAFFICNPQYELSSDSIVEFFFDDHLSRVFPYSVRSSSLACSRIRNCSLSRFLPARLSFAVK